MDAFDSYTVEYSPERNELLRKIKNCEDVNDMTSNGIKCNQRWNEDPYFYEGKLQMVFRVAKFDKREKLRIRRSAAN